MNQYRELLSDAGVDTCGTARTVSRDKDGAPKHPGICANPVKIYHYHLLSVEFIEKKFKKLNEAASVYDKLFALRRASIAAKRKREAEEQHAVLTVDVSDDDEPNPKRARTSSSAETNKPHVQSYERYRRLRDAHWLHDVVTESWCGLIRFPMMIPALAGKSLTDKAASLPQVDSSYTPRHGSHAFDLMLCGPDGNAVADENYTLVVRTATTSEHGHSVDDPKTFCETKPRVVVFNTTADSFNECVRLLAFEMIVTIGGKKARYVFSRDVRDASIFSNTLYWDTERNRVVVIGIVNNFAKRAREGYIQHQRQLRVWEEREEGFPQDYTLHVNIGEPPHSEKIVLFKTPMACNSCVSVRSSRMKKLIEEYNERV